MNYKLTYKWLNGEVKTKVVTNEQLKIIREVFYEAIKDEVLEIIEIETTLEEVTE